MNLDMWFRRKCRLKVFLIWISGSPFVQQSETICAILVEGIMRKNSVKLFLNLDQWFKSRCCLKDSYLELWQPSCLKEQNHLCNFERGHHGYVHVKLYEIWTSGSGDVV